MRPKFKLTEADKKYIHKYYNEKTPDQIARYLEKPSEIIAQYIQSNLLTQDEVDNARECPELRQHPQWKFWVREYTPEELVLFEQIYLDLKEQFDKEGILATEQSQVIQAIELQIFMHRNKKNARKAVEDIERLEDLVRHEMGRDREDVDKGLIQDLQKQIDATRSGIQSSAAELERYLKQYTTIIDKLKGTREARIKQIENAKVNFLGLIKQLEDEDIREKKAQEAEILKKAFLQEESRLSAYHTYADGNVDMPLMTSKHIKRKDNAK